MKKVSFILLLVLAEIIVLPKSFAYLDPGTGGVILSSIWPLIVALFSAIGAFFIKFFWKPIKKHISKTFGSNKK